MDSKPNAQHIFKEAVPEYWQDNHTVLVCWAEEIVESILGAVMHGYHL